MQPAARFPETFSPKSGEKRNERPQMTPHDEKPMTATTTKTKQKETTMMKTKLVKRIASCSLFACALASLIATVPLGTSATARPEPDPHSCNAGMLRGLYLWTFDGFQYFGG